MDNLESQTYEAFEKDPVKYAQYEKAIVKALEGMPQQDVTVVMVSRRLRAHGVFDHIRRPPHRTHRTHRTGWCSLMAFLPVPLPQAKGGSWHCEAYRVASGLNGLSGAMLG